MAFGRERVLWTLLNPAVSLLVYMVLFALIFKLFSDAKMRWRDVWIGAAIPAVLFSVGKHLIGLYRGHSAVASSYGAVALVALIVWVYYSAIIVFVGAEVTEAFVRKYGAGMEPDEYAMPKQKQDN